MNNSVKYLLAGLMLAGSLVALSGCVPSYSYVQGNGYAGDAYYGSGPAVIYGDPYGYYPWGGYYGGYWGGYYGYYGGYRGCCHGGGRYWRGGGLRGGGHGVAHGSSGGGHPAH
ncbi:hypothetical protein ISP15_10860 [Dyella jejuensis]|uniref:Glycine-rich protein n=1 Tax=Dyella jejuensis TaxID=1432009 RepID=A0ABW8JKM6_9GAMM